MVGGGVGHRSQRAAVLPDQSPVNFRQVASGGRRGQALGSLRLHDAPPRSCPPCFTLLLPEVTRYRRARIGLDAANLLPAIDDDKVEVYARAPRQEQRLWSRCSPGSRYRWHSHQQTVGYSR